MARYRDPVFRPSVRPATFATTLASTLLFGSVSLKPFEILWQNKYFQAMCTEQVR